MSKLLICLFVAFSLLIVPMAQAVEIGCRGDSCQISKQIEKQSEGKKQSDSTHANTAQHCCSAHVASDKVSYIIDGLTGSSASKLVFEEDDLPSSVVIGPPLKPPSRA